MNHFGVKFWHVLCTCRCLSKEVGKQYFRVTDKQTCQTWHWWRVVCDLTSHNNTLQRNWHWCRVVCDLTSHNNTSQKNWHWWSLVCDLTSHKIHHKRIDIDEGWCATWHHLTIHHKRIDIDEGWCATWHHVTIHQKRIDIDEGWCATWHHVTIHQKRIDIDEGWCATWHHLTIHHKRIDIDEGRCETWHHITIHHKRIDIAEERCQTWHHITIRHKRIIGYDKGVWDLTSHNKTSQKNNRLWHRVATWHHSNNTSQKNGDIAEVALSGKLDDQITSTSRRKSWHWWRVVSRLWHHIIITKEVWWHCWRAVWD